jgi:Asp-tRNA(Asn)/Glu-tRNA(Gln) amidotransferase A subunit family amidase
MRTVPSSGAELQRAAPAGGPPDWGLAEAAAALRAGQLRAEDYVQSLLERCAAASHLNAFAALDPEDLLAGARRLDVARGRGLPMGPLHGLPVAFKDNIDALPYATAAGTPALRGVHPQADAGVVRRLVGAGALIAGKTTMHELAMGWTGQNAAYGDTRNPHAPGHMAGGSSGGSACSVAAGLVPAAIGTDTNGSIRVPSAFCGIVGLRPTHGRYPLDGVVPLAPSLDTAGPMARSVDDVALLDAVMAGVRADPVVRVDPRSLRLGIGRDWFWSRLDASVSEAMAIAIERLERQGVQLVAIDLPGLQDLAADVAPATIGREAGRALAAFLGARPDGPQLADVRGAVGPDLAAAVAAFRTGPAPAAGHAAAHKRDRLRSLWCHAFEANRLDALVHPAVRVTAPPLHEPRLSPGPQVLTRWGWMQGREAFAQNATPASLVGAPSLVLPAHRQPSLLPVGVQLDGLPGGDRRLLAVAATVEALLARG